ncbi:hypothetical protein D8682_08550 [Buttiauxella sp. 3AFRM03]|uniref:hypothetical protein n=1 Tax=Buttiauxella sp. 3AFRM03 TaxID=2479367 RepID=UPI000EF7DD29|nr:hypothetical protein [Buttiauxella sp. 3AFRM03]AYN27032.1 hypothetical protein D8682_08550 [Buttiauxella sp. 3AFRM03]
MIIPNARFLRHSYEKNKRNLTQRSENEKRMMAGILVKELRNPQTHKLGYVSCFFSKEKYPITVNGGAQRYLNELVHSFISAGYDVTIDKAEDGFSINLNWTTACSPIDLP